MSIVSVILGAYFVFCYIDAIAAYFFFCIVFLPQKTELNDKNHLLLLLLMMLYWCVKLIRQKMMTIYKKQKLASIFLLYPQWYKNWTHRVCKERWTFGLFPKSMYMLQCTYRMIIILPWSIILHSTLCTWFRAWIYQCASNCYNR